MSEIINSSNSDTQLDREGNLSHRMIWADYNISDIDDASNPKYYGFITMAGSWYILQENTTAKTYRYAVGSSGYATAWTNRALQDYGYFSEKY